MSQQEPVFGLFHDLDTARGLTADEITTWPTTDESTPPETAPRERTFADLLEQSHTQTQPTSGPDHPARHFGGATPPSPSPSPFLTRLKRTFTFAQNDRRSSGRVIANIRPNANEQESESESESVGGIELCVTSASAPAACQTQGSASPPKKISDFDLKRLSTRLVRVGRDENADPSAMLTKKLSLQKNRFEQLRVDVIPPWIQIAEASQEQKEQQKKWWLRRPNVAIVVWILTIITTLIGLSLVFMWFFSTQTTETSIRRMARQLRDSNFRTIEEKLTTIITYPLVVSNPLQSLMTKEIESAQNSTILAKRLDYLQYIHFGKVEDLPLISVLDLNQKKISGYYTFNQTVFYVYLNQTTDMADIYGIDPHNGVPVSLLMKLPLSFLGGTAHFSFDPFLDPEMTQPIYRIEHFQSGENQFVRLLSFHFPITIPPSIYWSFILSLSYEMTAFEEFLDSLEYSKNAEFFLLSSDGYILATNQKFATVNGSIVHYFNSPNLTLITESNNKRFKKVGQSILKTFGSFGKVDHVYETHFSVDGKSYSASVSYFSNTDAISNLFFVFGVVSPDSDFYAIIDENHTEYTQASIVIICATLVMGCIISYVITRPLQQLELEMNRLQLLDFTKEIAENNTKVDPSTLYSPTNRKDSFELTSSPQYVRLTEGNLSRIKEVRVIQENFLSLKRGLHSFSRYVPREIVTHILSYDGEARLGVKHAMMTVFFSDIENYTALAESMNPSALIEFLGQYFTVVTDAISAKGGMVAEFLGDGVMAFWNAPTLVEDHAGVAIDAALCCQKALDDLQAKWRRKKLLSCSMKSRIGVNTGEVLVGNIGAPNRMKFGIVGDNVNLASRIEGLNKMFGTQLIVSEETKNRASRQYVYRPLMRVMVKGRRTPTLIYEVLGRLGEASEETLAKANNFHRAFTLYYSREFQACLDILSDKLFANDKPSQLLIERCQKYLDSSVPLDWTGVEHLEKK